MFQKRKSQIFRKCSNDLIVQEKNFGKNSPSTEFWYTLRARLPINHVNKFSHLPLVNSLPALKKG